MSITLRPLEDRIVVRRCESQRMTPSGLILPDISVEIAQEGHVLAVGPGLWKDGQYTPMNVKVGDRVLFGKYSGALVDTSDKMVTVMRAGDLLCVIEGADELSKAKSAKR